MAVIREATVEDDPRLVELSCEFLALTPYGRLFPPAAGAVERMVALTRKHGAIFVAEVTDEDVTEVVGMVAVVVIPHPLTGGIYAEEMVWYVTPELRGGTVGPRLLQVAECWAGTQGATLLKMVAPAGSAVGEFLERRGYTAVETAYMRPLRPRNAGT